MDKMRRIQHTLPTASAKYISLVQPRISFLGGKIHLTGKKEISSNIYPFLKNSIKFKRCPVYLGASNGREKWGGTNLHWDSASSAPSVNYSTYGFRDQIRE